MSVEALGALYIVLWALIWVFALVSMVTESPWWSLAAIACGVPELALWCAPGVLDASAHTLAALLQ